MMTAQMII